MVKVATVNFIPCKNQSYSSMNGTIKYILQDFKCCISKDLLNVPHQKAYKDTEDSDKTKLVSGKDCCPETAFNEFKATKKLYSKENGVFFYHYDQSFKIGENISPATAHEIARKFAEDNYKGFEVLVATHIDKDHLHSHFLINSVSFENGKKLHQGTDTIKKLRTYSDEICKSYGLSTLPKYEKGRTKTISSKEYRTAEKGQSWKFKLMNSIDECMKISYTKEQFLKNMERLGYGVKWTDTRKNITYHCPNNMDCRDNKLHEEKYLKGNMENEFRYRAIETEEQGGYINSGGKQKTDGIPVAGRTLADNNIPSFSSDGTVTINNEYDKYPVQGGAFGESCGQDSTNRGRIYAENNHDDISENRDDDIGISEFPITGWENEREQLQRTKGIDEHNFEPVPADAVQTVKQNDNMGSIISGITNLGNQISKIIQPQPQNSTTKRYRVDSKDLQKIKEKKIALGQKDSDKEDNGWEQKM